MKIERFPVGPLEVNCYHVICGETGESVLIDPGDVPRELFRPGRDLRLRMVLLTHGHFDHAGGAERVRELTGAPVAVHELDVPLLGDPVGNGSALFGMGDFRLTPDILLASGEKIEFGACSIAVLHTPGHTPGGVSFLSGDGQTVFSGDTLFRLSVGRWDLPGGDYRTLIHTLDTVFRPMPDATVVYPGHGGETVIGYERRHNEFLVG